MRRVTPLVILAACLLLIGAGVVMAEAANNTTAPGNVTAVEGATVSAAVLGVMWTVVGAGVRTAYGRYQNAGETTDWHQVEMTLAIGFISGAAMALFGLSHNPAVVAFVTNPLSSFIVGIVATDAVEAVMKGTIRRLPARLVADAGPVLLMLLKSSKAPPTPPDTMGLENDTPAAPAGGKDPSAGAKVADTPKEGSDAGQSPTAPK